MPALPGQRFYQQENNLKRNYSETDIKYMAEALALAEKARGATSPNPMVGAVIVRDGAVVGRGYHKRAGTPHAEVHALRQAGDKARGATMYVTLEPCSHFGRTPPCAPAVAAAGIKKVVAAMKDPNPKVAGRGFAILRKAGVEVVTGVLENEAKALNAAFIKYVTTGKPLVILKAAVTLDGKTATGDGDSKWITGESARRDVHRLRGECDAVLVGIGTLLKDDPQLTCRLPGAKRQPYRIVIDGGLDIGLKSNFCKLAADGKTIVATLPDANAAKAKKLEKSGVKVLRVPEKGTGKIDISQLLAELGKMSITSLLVEGGGETHFSFLSVGEADRAMFYIAPKLLGGKSSHTAVDGEGFGTIAAAVGVGEMEMKRFGNDIRISAEIMKR